MRRLFFFLLFFALALSMSCASGDDQTPADITDGDIEHGGRAEFDRDERSEQDEAADVDDEHTENEHDGDAPLPPGPVNGWILLDNNEEAITRSIEKAASFGVNHIQLSHSIIMYVEDVLGDDEAAWQRVEMMNNAIELAHAKGMEVYFWAHEFSGERMSVCYGPEGAVWSEQKEKYTEAFRRMPKMDGVILMFGSSSPPPWFTICDCDWCEENYEGNLLEIPPPEERVRLTVEHIGGHIVNQLGKKLFVRTFVHEPAEIAWHSDGLSGVENVRLTGMHKGPVQDWQPYNPHHGCIGNIGAHPAVLELDIAGEYYGQSILPFCSPGYYRYRLAHSWKHGGIGAVLRIERGSHHAIGTPNEINLYAISQLIEENDKPLDAIWDEFLQSFYSLPKAHEAQPILKRILKDTFPIRLKSHYVLGIWALSKGSDIPEDYEFDQFSERGEMPKWDADWQAVYEKLKSPDMATVLNVLDEGREAVSLAEESLALAAPLEEALQAEQWADLQNRLRHQHAAAKAWMAVKFFLWANRALGHNPTEAATLYGWMQWAHDLLKALKAEMEVDAFLASAPIASPARIGRFIENTADKIPEGTAAIVPPAPLFSPIEIVQVTNASATIRFSASASVRVHIDYGREMPDYAMSTSVDLSTAHEVYEITLTNLLPRERYVVRLRTEHEGMQRLSGERWVFTKTDGGR